MDKIQSQILEDEIFFESYLTEQFKATDLLQENLSYLGGKTLKTYAKEYGKCSITARLLNDTNVKTKTAGFFNIHNKKKDFSKIQ